MEEKLSGKQVYYKKNRDTITKKQKEYYALNKDKINKKQLELIMCDVCHQVLTRASKSRHVKSKRHILAKNIVQKKPKIESCERKSK